MPTLEKLTITSAEIGLTVPALFNPKDLGIDKSVPWQEHPRRQGEVPGVEFTTGAPRTLSLELLTDRFEDREGQDVYTQFVAKLERFVTIDERLKRPPLVKLTWARAPRHEAGHARHTRITVSRS